MALVLLALAGMTGGRLPEVPETRLVLYGVDGADWDLLRDLVSRGEVPAFADCIERGAAGPLLSEEPMLSPILWTTIATGRSPAEHGLLDMYGTARQVRVKRFWDVFEGAGLRTGTFCYPMTWPPSETACFSFPSLFDQGSETEPPSIQFIRETIMEEKGGSGLGAGGQAVFAWKAVGEGLRLSTAVEAARLALDLRAGRFDASDRYWRERIVMLHIYRDVFIHLLDSTRPHVAAFYMNAVDAFGHLYWQPWLDRARGEDTELARRFGDVVPLAYREADALLSTIRSIVGDEATVVTASDHGFRSVEGREYTSYVVKTESLLATLGVADQVTGTNLTSSAYIRPMGDGFDLEALGALLRSITVSGTGEPLFEWRLDTMGNGVLRVRRQIRLEELAQLDSPSGRFDAFSVVEPTGLDATGTHDIEGVVLLIGGSVVPGAVIEEATIYDLTPTLLALGGIPAARDMPGRVLAEALAPDLLAILPADRVDTWGDADAVLPDVGEEDTDALKERLRALGYLK